MTASSTQADPDALGFTQRGALPEAALDGDPRTAWRSAAFASDAPWWQAGPRASPRDLGAVTVRVGNAGDEVLVVSTPDWESSRCASRPGSPGRSRCRTPRPRSPCQTCPSGRATCSSSPRSTSASTWFAAWCCPRRRTAWGRPTRSSCAASTTAGAGAYGSRTSSGVRRTRLARLEEARDVRRRFMSPASDVGAPVRMLVSPDPGPELDEVILRRSAGVGHRHVRRRGRSASEAGGRGGRRHRHYVDRRRSATLNPELRLSWLGQRTVTASA